MLKPRGRDGEGGKMDGEAGGRDAEGGMKGWGRWVGAVNRVVVAGVFVGGRQGLWVCRRLHRQRSCRCSSLRVGPRWRGSRVHVRVLSVVGGVRHHCVFVQRL